MAKMHKKADEKHNLLRKQQEEMTKHLLAAFHDVLSVCKEETSPDIIGKNVMTTMSHHGGVETLHDECEQVVAYHSDSYFHCYGNIFPKENNIIEINTNIKFTISFSKSIFNKNAANRIKKFQYQSEYFEDDTSMFHLHRKNGKN